LINRETLDKYDPGGMHKVYDKWPRLAREAYESDLEPVDFKNIDHIVFAGMGGSGAIGDLFLSILSKTSIHVTVVKGYLLPKTVDSKTLVVVTSVSGNTIETYNVVKTAKEFDCEIICFSSGGKLEKFCKNNTIVYRNLRMHNNPRASFPIFVYSILKVLASILPINKKDIEDSILRMEKLSEKISTKNITNSNSSLSLAYWLDEIPIIYYPWGFQAAAIRFKNSIQENMKSHAMTEDMIEACHNGIVAWEQKSNVKPILIRGTKDYVRTKERWDILIDYFKKNDIDYWEIVSNDGNILSKIINLIYLFDFATLYGAIINQIDPTPVNSIDFIKSRLN